MGTFIGCAVLLGVLVICLVGAILTFRNGQREKPIRDDSPMLQTGKCRIKAIAISESQGESYPVYSVTMEYTFLEDPDQRTQSMDVVGNSLEEAYHRLTQYVPEGTPFEFRPINKYQNPLVNRAGQDYQGTPIPYLMEGDYAFLINSRWSDAYPDFVEVKHVQGDYRINAWNFSPGENSTPTLLVLGLVVVMIAAFYFSGFQPGGFARGLSPNQLVALAIGAVVLAVFQVMVDKKQPFSKIPKNFGKHFFISATTVKNLPR
ncbi:MAG: hypothetical protein ABI036_00825 [Fibrobacteria bacterium]